jgi:hypothetical protein
LPTAAAAACRTGIEALGLRVPAAEITIGSVRLVAQAQVGHSWQWQPVAEVRLGQG